MVTMEDIAQHAGVSRTTVSFVLNKRRSSTARISEETRCRVLSAASQLNYQTNELAKSVVTGKNRVLGILTSPAMHNAFEIMAGANEAAEESDYLLKILHLSYDAVGEDAIARCRKWRLAGVIVFGFSEDTYCYLHDEFERVGMPLAVLDDAPRSSRWGVRACTDDAQGIRLLVSHLVGLGHRRIAFLGGDSGLLASWREQIFREQMDDLGLPLPDYWVRKCSWLGDTDNMRQTAWELLVSAGNRPTAIICASDLMAMMVQRVARSLGMHLPDDLSVTGYGDSAVCNFADSPLTTVMQSFHELGRIGVQKVIQFAEAKDAGKVDDPVREFLVPVELVVRDSTTCPSSAI